MWDVNRTLTKSASQSHTLEAIGHAEDLSSIVTNIEPDYTMFLSEFGTAEDAVELDFSWLTEGLRPPQVNAHLEAEDWTSQYVGSMEGMTNNCQRFVNSGKLTNAQIKVKKVYEPQDEFTRQLGNTLIEHARDIEYFLVNNDSKNVESGTTPAMSGGVPYFMQVQNQDVTVSEGTASSGNYDTYTTSTAHDLRTGDFVYFTGTALPTGVSANTLYYVRVDSTTPATVFSIFNTMKGAVENVSAQKVVATTAGTAVKIVKNNIVDAGNASYTLDHINNAMQMAFNRGGNPTVAYMSPQQKRRFSSLVTAMTTIYRDVAKKAPKIDLVADAMETDFGTIVAKAHRLYGDNRIDILDMNYWDLKWFEHTHTITDLPNKGSYKEYQVESWLGLKGTQPKASASIINIKR